MNVHPLAVVGHVGPEVREEPWMRRMRWRRSRR